MTPFGWQHAKVKSTKSNPPSKVAKSAFMGTLFEQPPQAQIRPRVARWWLAYEILVSAQGPLVLGFWVFGLRVLGQGLTIHDES